MAGVSDSGARLPHAHAHLHRASSDAALLAALTALRESGERVTTARRAVLETLARTHEHVSADDVAALLEASRPPVHRASVYRTLELLTRLGIATHLHAGTGATVYHLASSPAGHEHLHARCRGCGDVFVVPADALDDAVDRVAAETGFRIEPGQSALAGLCAGCTAR